MYKVLVVPHLLSEVQRESMVLQEGPHPLAFAQYLGVGFINVDLSVYIDLLFLGNRGPLVSRTVRDVHLILIISYQPSLLVIKASLQTLWSQIRTIKQSVGPLHHQVLNWVIGLLLGGDLKDDRIDLFPSGDLFPQIFFADFLGDEYDRDQGVPGEAIEGILYELFGHFWVYLMVL